ncbi:MAG: hypothetical protein ACFS24_00485 [Candidatus Karelsulcia muelleri]
MKKKYENLYLYSFLRKGDWIKIKYSNKVDEQTGIWRDLTNIFETNIFENFLIFRNKLCLC